MNKNQMRKKKVKVEQAETKRLLVERLKKTMRIVCRDAIENIRINIAKNALHPSVFFLDKIKEANRNEFNLSNSQIKEIWLTAFSYPVRDKIEKQLNQIDKLQFKTPTKRN